MGYTTDDSFVRIDFFKPSGKWYCTESMKWKGYNGFIHDEFKESLREHIEEDRGLSGMHVVCLEPHNINSYPLMIKVDDIWS